MDALIIMLREGIEMSLVIGIVLAYLNKTGRTHLNRYVYLGLGSAIVFSLAIALVFKLVGIDADNDIAEGIIYLTASVFVASMVAWMWKTGRQIKQQMEEKMARITSVERTSFMQMTGIFALTFLMIAREGVETALFFSALSLGNTSQLITLIGASAGLLLAVGFGVFFIKGSLRLNLHKFFSVTSLVLLLLVLKFLFGGIHAFAEAGLIHVSGVIEDGLEFIAENNLSTWLIVALLTYPIISAIARSLGKGTTPGISPAVDRESSSAS